MKSLKLIHILYNSPLMKYSQNTTGLIHKHAICARSLGSFPLHYMPQSPLSPRKKLLEIRALKQPTRFYAKKDDECYEEDNIMCHSELRQMMKQNKIVINDVRNEDETWRTGTIPGSLCVPLKQLECALSMDPERFNEAYCREKPKRSDQILFVCRRGQRSFQAVKTARKMGYQRTQFYQGGFIQWFNEERKKRE